MWLGIAIALMPFLGFPSSWKTAFYLISGIFIAYNTYQLGKHARRESRRSRKPKGIFTPAAIPGVPEADIASLEPFPGNSDDIVRG